MGFKVMINWLLDSSQPQVQTSLFITAEAIVRRNGNKMEEGGVISSWIATSEQLLTQQVVAPDLQEAASNFLVALGYSQHCTRVIYRVFIPGNTV